MPPRRVSGLAARSRGRIEVSLDGESWRVLPAEAVLAAGLDVGVLLDRVRARRLAQALRRHTAMMRATRSLAYRDFSERQLAERLARAGHAPAVRSEVVERLVGSGAVDDERLARNRAELLSGRGAGDALIRHDLESRGISAELAEGAIGGLEPEEARAATIVAERGATPKTARYLARKGFSEDAIASSCEQAVAEDAPSAVR